MLNLAMKESQNNCKWELKTILIAKDNVQGQETLSSSVHEQHST